MANFVDFSYLATTVNQGKAIFSTKFAEFAPRTAVEPLPPIILRYNPRVDVPAFKDTLRRRFPLQCHTVTAPIDNLYEYFDHYDLHIQGAEFIYAVLVKIALENSTRAKQILDFAGRWKTENFEKFHILNVLTSDLFTEEQKQSHDEEFLSDALAELKKLRDAFSSDYMGGTSGPTAVTPVQYLAPDDGVQPETTYSVAMQPQVQSPIHEIIHSPPQPQKGLPNTIVNPTNNSSAPLLSFPTAASQTLRPPLQRHNTTGVKACVRNPTHHLDNGYSSAPTTSPVDTIPNLGEPQQYDELPHSPSTEMSNGMPMGLPLGPTLPSIRSEHPSSHAEAKTVVNSRSQNKANACIPAFEESEYLRQRNLSSLEIHRQEPVMEVRRGPCFDHYGHPINTQMGVNVANSSVSLAEMDVAAAEMVVGNLYPATVALYEHSGTQPMGGAYNAETSSLLEVKPLIFEKATFYSDEQQPVFNGSTPQPQYVPGVGSNLVGSYGHFGHSGSVGSSGAWMGFSNDARRVDQQSLHQRKSYTGGPNIRGQQPVYTSEGSSQLIRRTSSGPKRGRQNLPSHAQAYEGHSFQSNDGYSGPARFRGGRGNRNYQGYNSSVRGSFPVQTPRSDVSDVQWSQSARRFPFDEVTHAASNAASTHWIADQQRAQGHDTGPHGSLGWQGPSSRESRDHANSYEHILRSQEEHQANSQNGPALESQQRSGEHYDTNLKQQPSHITIGSSRDTHYEDTKDRQHQATKDPSKLYVGNLPLNIKESTVKDMFGRFGNVVNVSLPNLDYGYRSCFGFVQFETHDQGLRAIEGLYDAQIEGKRVVVRIARGKRDRYDRYQHQSDLMPQPSQAASELQHTDRSYDSASRRPNITYVPRAQAPTIHHLDNDPKAMQRTPKHGRCGREEPATPTSRPQHKGSNNQSMDLSGMMSNTIYDHASGSRHERLVHTTEVKEGSLRTKSQPYEQNRQISQARQKAKQEKNIEASRKTHRSGNSTSEGAQYSEQDRRHDAETRDPSVVGDRNVIRGRQGQSLDGPSMTPSHPKDANGDQATYVEDSTSDANQNGHRSLSEVSRYQKLGSGGYSGRNNPARDRSYRTAKGSRGSVGELNPNTSVSHAPPEVDQIRVSSVLPSVNKDQDRSKNGPGSNRSTPKKSKKNSKSGTKKASPKKMEGKNSADLTSDTAFPPLGPKSDSKHNENAKPPARDLDDTVNGYYLDKGGYTDTLLETKATEDEAERCNETTTSENPETSHGDDPFRMPQPRPPPPELKSLANINAQRPGSEKQSEVVNAAGAEAGIEADAVIITSRSKRLTYSQVASQPKKIGSQPKQKVLQTKNVGAEVTSNAKRSPQKKGKVKLKETDPWAVPDGEKAWGENQSVGNGGKVNNESKRGRSEIEETEDA
ncbi:MAG: Protein phosphatase PP2A regulatory subunit B [Pleopsidium flavum]|nr:MAG: Protein phosphatase PP2A regulatory subunit B [Pleopsidium flavum]